MNIEQAKSIPLADILRILGFEPTQQKNHQSKYLSPLRQERTPSFYVHTERNIWHDFGTGKGGSVIDFICEYLQTQDVCYAIPDALRWLENMMGYAPIIQPIKAKFIRKPDPKLVVRDTCPIKRPALVAYLKNRGIALELAKIHLKEVVVQNTETNKRTFALGFRNETGGHEIRNKFFKGCVGRKNISFIRGSVPKPDGIHIFEGFMDYLSAVMHKEGHQFKDDTLILNSLSCLKLATPYIKGYGYKSAYTWMDNDEAGKEATKSLANFFETENCLVHHPMNSIYAPHKDVNAWHMAKLNLV
jgi:hypothetical protein